MSKMNNKIAIIGAVDLGKTTTNMIEVKKCIEANLAFAPEPTKITNPYANLPEIPTVIKSQFKKKRKQNNRKKKRRK